MALSIEQLKKRRLIGSSDVAALFTDGEGNSLTPFQTAYDVWVDKTYTRKRNEDTAAQSFGHRYEDALVDFASKELGCQIENTPEKLEFLATDILDKNGEPFNLSHPDGYTIGSHVFGTSVFQDTSGIEAKTSSNSNEWGDSGSDAVPFRVILQAQHQMLCTGWKRVFVPVLIGRFRLHEEMYLIERDERIITAIIQRVTEFWNDHVLTRVPPAETLPGNIEIYKRIERVPSSFATVDMERIAAWEAAKDAQKIAENNTGIAFFKVMEQLGDAEGANLEDGRTLTYFTENGGIKLDTEKLKKEFPEVYLACANQTTRRVIRIKKAEA